MTGTRLSRRLLLGLLICHAALLAWGAYRQSPTFNEPGHLVAGISNWQFGRFDVYSVNPPLVRMVAAAPVLLAGAKTEWRSFREGPGARPEFGLGADFVAANGERSSQLFTFARWACIPFGMLGACVCFWWGRDLYGPAAGLLAAVLWCFCPNILAHGQLITSDAAATALGVFACYTFWRWLKRPTWWHALVSGVVLGIAELAKTTLVIFYPLWPLLWLVYRWPQRRELGSRDWLREAGMLVARMIVGLYVINLGYGFEGTFTRLGYYRFVSAALGTELGAGTPSKNGGNRFTGTWLENVPIPLPKHYVLGIDLQKQDFENYDRPSYLRGQFSPKGWWYYYLYALAIKVPLGTWLLVGLATTARFWGRTSVTWNDELILLSPALVILAFVSSQTGFSEHMRYVLPIFPFVFIWVGRVATLRLRQHRLLTGAVVAALAWSICSSLWICPHSLSYFNELVGGPTGGSAHLIQSNVDWGQDLLELKRWLNRHPEAKPLNLVYFGYFDPEHASLPYVVPERLLTGNSERIQVSQIPAGWYAVSANFVRGYPWFVYTGSGSEAYLDQNQLTAFQELKPVAMAGYSILIYHVER
jgi:4-amino-4-deoxy-L-arabinose transferase-like glycosyltransferase